MDCTDPKQFVHALFDERFFDGRQRYLFRGAARLAYDLLPRALRDDKPFGVEPRSSQDNPGRGVDVLAFDFSAIPTGGAEMLATFVSVFGVIFVAELPDKTALAALVLASRHKPAPVWIGASLALTVQSLVAVAAGSLFALLPARAVHIGSGIAFLVSAVFMWRRHEEADVSKDRDGKLGFWKTLGTTFAIVFIAEWGDLTQVGTAALAAHYHAPATVFAGSTAALWAVAGIAVFVGNRAGKLLDPNRTKRIAAVVFAVVGLALVSGKL